MNTHSNIEFVTFRSRFEGLFVLGQATVSVEQRVFELNVRDIFHAVSAAVLIVFELDDTYDEC